MNIRQWLFFKAQGFSTESIMVDVIINQMETKSPWLCGVVFRNPEDYDGDQLPLHISFTIR